MPVPGGPASAACRVEALLRAGSKCVAVGRNYAAHARELGNAPPSAPFFFFKPRSSYTWTSVEVPPGIEELHHEVELGVVVGRRMRDVAPERAMEHVAGYFAAVDVTARCVQARAKAKGLPWSAAKGYDTFCAISPCVPRRARAHTHRAQGQAQGAQSSDVADGDVDGLELWLEVDGEQRQRGTCAAMTWKVPELLAHISSICTLEEGDTVLTGTPEGVGPMRAGQKVRFGIEGLVEASVDVVKRPTPLHA